MGRLTKKQRVYLGKYSKKEISLRILAKKLNVSLWGAHELIANTGFPYCKEDLKRDLRLVRGV